MSCPHGRPAKRRCATCTLEYNRRYYRRRKDNGGKRLGFSRKTPPAWPQPQTEIDREFIAWASTARWPVGWRIAA